MPTGLALRSGWRDFTFDIHVAQPKDLIHVGGAVCADPFTGVRRVAVDCLAVAGQSNRKRTYSIFRIHNVDCSVSAALMP